MRKPNHSVNVVLASASPRRQEMLKDLKIPFKTFIPGIRETWRTDASPRRTAIELAVKKCERYRGRNALVIGMDTIVAVKKIKLGKPINAVSAKAMLQLLSNRTHEVITGVALKWKGRLISAVAITRVEFREITLQQMEWYVATGEPFDKAGGYAIQGLGRIFINRIDGCYYNVVGFPLTLFQRMLRRFGFTILDLQRLSGD